MKIQRLSHCTPTTSQRPRKIAVEFPGVRVKNQTGPTRLREKTVFQARTTLNLIDINFLATLSIIITLITSILVELEIAISVAFLSVCVGLVDLRRFGEFAVGF